MAAGDEKEFPFSIMVVREICRLISCGAIMPDIERMAGMPKSVLFYEWCNDNPEVEEMHHKALLCRMKTRQDEHTEMIRNCPKNLPDIKLLEIQIKDDLWFMERLYPKKYGQRTVVAGDKDNPLTVNVASALDAAILARAAQSRTIEHAPMKMPAIEADASE